ncbi:hypothetical protein MMC26_001724 [Xylographa opegraphella]|nr:hypothetical protein [Xylographa opegraphella]
MSHRSGERHRLGHRPRNNLSSSKGTQFGTGESQHPQAKLIQDHRIGALSPEQLDYSIQSQQSSSPAAFTFNGNNTSLLGDSTSSFSSPATSDFSYAIAGSPTIRFSDKASDSLRGSTFRTASPEELLGSPLVKQGLTGQRLSKQPATSENMVVEREPARGPLSPAKSSQQPQSNASRIEFGKASTPQSPLRNSVFNIPKPGQPRPEHHRPNDHNARASIQVRRDAREGFRVPLQNYDPVTLQPIVKKNEEQDVVEIARPTNSTSWSSHPAHPPATYSSLVHGISGFATVNTVPSENLDQFVDLTETALFADKFGAPDAYQYVDPEQATKNLKALLHGAFEDEENKPKTRGRRRKLQESSVNLVDKLRGLKVGSESKVDSKHDGTGEDEEEAEEEEDDGSVEGMKVKLLPHQVDGVNWMRDKESGVTKKNSVLPKGGILADDVKSSILRQISRLTVVQMGLGKTIQSIALLLTNPRPALSSTLTSNAKADKHKISNTVGKGTLVVAPLALIKQWEAEIANRVENSHKLRVCVHHGPQRTKRSEDLRKYDVVITTYQILVSEHGNSSATVDAPQVGCFGLHWYRVILDEAHTIKNRNAKATQACYALRAEYRWCLTGTPMQNNLDELQSLIKFLRIKPYNELAVWREQITKPMNSGRGGIAMKRLQFFLKVFMKRRTKDVLKVEGALNPGGKADVEGNPNNGFIITERKIEKVVAQFTDKEQKFYESLEQRTDQSLEKMMSGKTMNYASALVLLLRLRQACNHPELVTRSMAKDKDALSTGQIAGTQSPGKSKAINNELDDMADLLSGLSVQTKQCDVCQLELTKEEAKAGSIRCSSCEGDLENFKAPKKERSKHKKNGQKVQQAKLKGEAPRRWNRPVIQDSDDEGNDEGEGDWLVAKSKRRAANLGNAGGSDDENAEGGGEWLASDDTDTGDEASVQILGSHRKKVTSLDTEDEGAESSDTSDEEADQDDHDESLSSDEEPPLSFITSTKIDHLVKILNMEAGTHKFIVFSQFTSMLDLIEPFLQKNRLVYTRYDGSMRNDLREASLERLRNEKKTRILLCSLKCGSLGLNLTAASRVVILEPFWNPFVEEQAIDRVHRLNQTVDVVVYKITIAGSVEERILDLQDKKRALAAAAIEGQAVAKLSMQDILNLFKHDAEHDPRHQMHDPLVAKTRVLPAVAPGSGPRDSSRRATPPVMQSFVGANRVKEDAVFGRRW